MKLGQHGRRLGVGTVTLALAVAVAAAVAPASAQWAGFIDRSTALTTNRFSFTGSPPEAGTGNENYYDGDLGDLDGDGLTDRLLGSRFGFLFNTGGGYMIPARRFVGMLLRGDVGASGWGEDAMQLSDIDGDGDLDAIMGGNGEPLTAQANGGGRFSIAWVRTTGRHSALNIVNTDVEGDGDVDLVVSHAFCSMATCGGPVDFALLINDGTGAMTEECVARGIGFVATDYIVGSASGDVDGDGDFDLVIERGGVNQVVVAINDGTGHYTQRPTVLPTSGSGFGQGLNLGDIDDDGDLDIALVRGGPVYPGGDPVITIAIGINDGAGNFADESNARLDAAGYVGTLQGGNGKLIDVDCDGDLDIIAFEKNNMAGTTSFAVHINDGTGSFRYDAAHSVDSPGPSSGLGSDVDIADLDGDGTYDVWVGMSGGNVREYMNTYRAPGGVAADMPRSLALASADTSGITIAWQAPAFASSQRLYHVYRSLAGAMHERDRRRVKTVGLSRFQDEGFSAPITRHTTTAELGDADVTLDGATNALRWIDRTAVPGVDYYYSVSHVGAEYEESVQTALVGGRITAAGGADTTGPVIEIVSPVTQDWAAYPRVAVAYGDGGSGIDPASLQVSFDRALGGAGGRAAGANIVDLAYRHDDHAFIAYLVPPLSLPVTTAVTMTASIADMAGNRSMTTVRFFVGVSAPVLPTASFTSAPRMGAAPLGVDFDASASADTDGAVMRWEWYFGDGTTGFGRIAHHDYAFGGTFDVVLRVRDNEGGVAVATDTITVTGAMPPPDAGASVDAGPPAPVDAGCTPACGGRMCGGDGCGGSCGTCSTDRTCGGGGACLCMGSLVDCAGSCVDTRVDEANCGACGMACAPGETCTGSMCVMGGADAGACVPDCTGRSCGDDACGGTCGMCAMGRLCVSGGMCECGAGETACSGACVDTRSSAMHCGMCGRACAAGDSCTAGMCVRGMAGMDAGVARSDGGGGSMTLDGGCGCSAPGTSGSSRAGVALALGALVMVMARARRRRGSPRGSRGRN